MHPALPCSNPVIQQTSSSFSPFWPPVGISRRLSIVLKSNRFQSTVKWQKTDVTRIQDLNPFTEVFYDKYNTDNVISNSLAFGGVEVTIPLRLNQTDFSLKQFAKRMEQPNYSTFNKWKKVWVARCLEKKHCIIIKQYNWFTLARDRPLNWEMGISNNSSFGQKHTGVPVGSVGSDGTWYLLMEN